MQSPAADLAIRLGHQAEAVCRHYLSAGKRAGNYWLVGDVQNTPGRSLYVRLTGPERGAGAAGQWADGATGEFGDLLDLIRACSGLSDLRDAMEEARRFLSLASPEPRAKAETPAKPGSSQSAKRLFAISEPIRGSLAETYLKARGITDLSHSKDLRYHPRCYWRPEGGGATEEWPAMIAAVTDPGGAITGGHRTWLARDGQGKAPIVPSRRAMGHLLGNGVRFGVAQDILAAGEGIETVLSVQQALPNLPTMAALSAGHLGAIQFPPGLARLYILRDPDPAGDAAVARLAQRARDAGIAPWVLSPIEGDFNDDLRRMGAAALRAHLRDQLASEDVSRLMP